MDQRKRFGFYIFGIGIGIVSVYFLFFGGPSTRPWTPNDMVLFRLKETLHLDDKANCRMKCVHFGHKDLAVLLEIGNVEFNRSQTEGDLKSYVVLASNKAKRKVRFTFECGPSVASISKVEFAEGAPASCPCDDEASD